MNTKPTEQETRDLLAAIQEAVAVPVAGYDDRDQELYLLRSRTAAIAGVLSAILEYDVTHGSAAGTLSRATDREPVTYAVPGAEVLAS